MYTVEMLPAAQGDCLWVEYGETGGPIHRVLIDGGTVGTIDEIRSKIHAVAEAEGRCTLDLLVVSHVDGDHIEGIIKLLGEPSLPLDVKDVWFNGSDHLPGGEVTDDDGFLSGKQGDFLSVVLGIRDLPWNRAPWSGNAVCVPPKDEGALPRHTLPGGMELTLVSPTHNELERLCDRWESELEKAGLAGWSDEEKLEALMASRTLAPDDDFLSEDDFGSAEPELNVASLAAEKEKNDHSAANGSSIAFIATYGGVSCLFAGDAYSSVLESSLDRLAEETGNGQVVLDAYKTPHHASRNNVHQALLHKMDCRRFLISTSGARFKHPDRQAIARLIGGDWRPDPANDRPVELIFNYESDFNSVWRDSALEAQWNYVPRFPDSVQGDVDGDPGIRVVLAP